MNNKKVKNTEITNKTIEIFSKIFSRLDLSPFCEDVTENGYDVYKLFIIIQDLRSLNKEQNIDILHLEYLWKKDFNVNKFLEKISDDKRKQYIKEIIDEITNLINFKGLELILDINNINKIQILSYKADLYHLKWCFNRKSLTYLDSAISLYKESVIVIYCKEFIYNINHFLYDNIFYSFDKYILLSQLKNEKLDECTLFIKKILFDTKISGVIKRLLLDKLFITNKFRDFLYYFLKNNELYKRDKAKEFILRVINVLEIEENSNNYNDIYEIYTRSLIEYLENYLISLKKLEKKYKINDTIKIINNYLDNYKSQFIESLIKHHNNLEIISYNDFSYTNEKREIIGFFNKYKTSKELRKKMNNLLIEKEIGTNEPIFIKIPINITQEEIENNKNIILTSISKTNSLKEPLILMARRVLSKLPDQNKYNESYDNYKKNDRFNEFVGSSCNVYDMNGCINVYMDPVNCDSIYCITEIIYSSIIEPAENYIKNYWFHYKERKSIVSSNINNSFKHEINDDSCYNDIMLDIKQSNPILKDHSKSFAQIIDSFLTNKRIIAIDALFSKLEDSLRIILNHKGISTKKYKTNSSDNLIESECTMYDLLEKCKENKLLDNKLLFYLKKIQELNLRNNSAHGFLKDEYYESHIFDLLFYLSLHIIFDIKNDNFV